MESIANRLDEFPIFGGIDYDTLSNVGDLFEPQSYEEGAHLIEQGTRGNRLYVITSGKVGVSMCVDPEDGGNGKDVLQLATMQCGECLGEMELIDTQERSATVIALEPTETLELTNMCLLKMFEREPTAFRMLIMNLARDLSRRLRAADQRLAILASTGVLPPARGDFSRDG